MQNLLSFKNLTKNEIPKISILCKQLRPELTLEQIKLYLYEMFDFENYNCFGLYLEDKLIGVSGGWVTVRLYSGKQLEVDHLVIDEIIQSRGYGKVFFEFIQGWAVENDCKTVELNTYVQNPRSHKFYFNQGYSIIGYHFWKKF